MLWRALLQLCVAWLWLAGVPLRAELPTDRLLRTIQPSADVNDFAGILTPAEKGSLEDRCRQLREKTGAQLAVVTLKSLEGGQIDDFAVKLFKRWGIGQKDQNNGVLLLVAIQDRKARIEVGYGLEPILPDGRAGRILDEDLFPAFKQQRYAEGLNATVAKIARIVETNEPAPTDIRPDRQGNGRLPIVAILSLFVAAGSFLLGAGLAKRVGCLIPFSLLFIVIPFLIGLSVAFPWAPLVHVPIGLVLGWLGWKASQDRLGGSSAGGPGGQAWTVPLGRSWQWSSLPGQSSWSGGGFSGGGGDWGGFGGGRSGGGGASGSW